MNKILYIKIVYCNITIVKKGKQPRWSKKVILFLHLQSISCLYFYILLKYTLAIWNINTHRKHFLKIT